MKSACPLLCRALQVACTLFALLVLTPASATAQDQLWLLSTRCLAGDADESRPDCWRWSGAAWQDAEETAFLATDAQTPTMILVHGNRYDAQDAVDEGWQVADELRTFAGGKPFRLLIWSWPAERMYRRNRTDVQAKAARCDVEAFHLGRLLNRLPPQAPVSLMGYSFGARVITGALHLAAGGSLDGRTLAEKPLATRRPLRALLIAPAENADWLAPGHCHDLALTQVEQALVTVNGCDRVLKLYRHIYRWNGPSALGLAGPLCLSDTDDAWAKLQLIDVSCSVGRTHDWNRYFSASEVRALLPWYARLQDRP